ncbi:MAG TPA: 2Fe-2S iron-sulfur cluster-binding protein [Xanthobacteraceae bacterium]
MNPVNLEINGKVILAEAEPRTHLADFLRNQQFLTGTHIGCEHGVCGACTVLLDGVPARSCITFAVACDGAQITTIEGLRDDPIMAELREAFAAHHALQCGYCTPGMLISCRDILMRLPDADEARIRRELSGNLCRCTGYVGLVSAVKSVQRKRKEPGIQATVTRKTLGPVGAHPSRETAAPRTYRTPPVEPPAPSAPPLAQTAVSAEQWRAVEAEGVELLQTFRVPFARDVLWNYFEHLDLVVGCMPGARLLGPPVANRAEGDVNVKLGPFSSAFQGVVEVERNPPRYAGVVRATGHDAKSGSNARAIISYHLKSLGAAETQVDISVRFLLAGSLAQFGRLGLVKDVGDHLTRVFASNLQAALSGKPVGDDANQPLTVASLAWLAIRKRMRAVFAKLRPRARSHDEK